MIDTHHIYKHRTLLGGLALLVMTTLGSVHPVYDPCHLVNLRRVGLPF